jgi:dCMP deaminase
MRNLECQSWDENFMAFARTAALRSKDPRTKVGASARGPGNELRTTGYNGFPRGVQDLPERWVAPEKYKWVKHAEENLIVNASRFGVALVGCALYCSASVCSSCAGDVVNAGFVEVVYPIRQLDPLADRLDWEEDVERARTILNEGGVQLRLVPF